VDTDISRLTSKLPLQASLSSSNSKLQTAKMFISVQTVSLSSLELRCQLFLLHLLTLHLQQLILLTFHYLLIPILLQPSLTRARLTPILIFALETTCTPLTDMAQSSKFLLPKLVIVKLYLYRSPNYPGTYPSDSDCSNRIATASNGITFVINYLSVEPYYDGVILYDSSGTYRFEGVDYSDYNYSVSGSFLFKISICEFSISLGPGTMITQHRVVPKLEIDFRSTILKLMFDSFPILMHSSPVSAFQSLTVTSQRTI
jgi:hypothetical protein